jgi:hypothetical protein
MTSDEKRKLAENWADKAIIAIRDERDVPGWVVDNREKLGTCEQWAPDAWARVKAALDKRSKDLMHAH